MKRFLKWLTVILLFFLLVSFGLYLFISVLLDTEPVVNDNSYLLIPLGGNLSEYRPSDPLEDYLSGISIDLRRIRQGLKMAAVDERIVGVVLSINPLQCGMAKYQELRRLIAAFRQSGKKIYAYIETATTRDYYLAAACDSVFLQPQGTLLLTGLASQVMFYKGILARFGIEADFERVGEYKNAPDVFMRKSLSETHREVLNNILDNYYDEIVRTIAADRGLDEKRVKYIIEKESGITPSEAVDFGLVDGISHVRNVAARLSSGGSGPEEMHVIDYSEINPRNVGLQKGPRIAIVYCSGTIAGGDDGDDPMFGQLLGADRIVDNLESISESRSIKAVVLRIDSPGGSGIASERVLDAVNRLSAKKPVVASISDLGASGGYYIAMGADTIVSQPGSLVGSIGIFIGKFSLAKLFREWDITIETLKRGENATLFALDRKFSASERKVVRKLIDDFYRNFIAGVAKHRNMDTGAADRIARGRVWTGTDGARVGLIDTLGGLDTAIELAKKLAGIEAETDPYLIIYPGRRSLLGRLFNRLVMSDDPASSLGERIIESVRRIQVQPLALMPYRLSFY